MNKLIGTVAAGVVALAAGVYVARDYVPFLGDIFGTSSTTTGSTTGTTGTTTAGTDSSGTTRVTTPPVADTDLPDFAFRRLETETGQDTPEACLVFTRNLVADGSVRYEDYLRFEPEADMALRVSDNRLCIQGLAFNDEYALEIREGLPAANGEKLTLTETIPVALRDRPSSVAFGEGFILPRSNAGGVPITTVNVDKLNIRVVRVGERMLARLSSYVLEQREVYSYESNGYEQDEGSLIWEGQMVVAGGRNMAVRTAFPVGDVIKDQPPGVYLVIAKDAARDERESEWDWDPIAAQWIINTDVALTTFAGEDGLTVFARNFSGAETMAGVKLQLVARNNEILGEATTDSDGRANFTNAMVSGAGGNEPAVITARAGDDFAYIDLRRSAFDLSDRGVEGRSIPDVADAFLYLDRGIYRPGETVYLTGLLRDFTANALGDMPVTLIVSKPDGQEFRRYVLNDEQLGGFAQSFTLSSGAPRGRWSAAAYADVDGEAIGRVQFDVQDFVPQRLKVELTPRETWVSTGGSATIDVMTRFLYGATGAGLTGEGEYRITRDTNPFPDLAGYSFGRVDEMFDEVMGVIDVTTADAEGRSSATAIFDQVPDTTLPLIATMRVAMHEPGGRTTAREVRVPVRTRNVMIGIRPLFEYEIAEGSEAKFEIVAVDANGQLVALPNVTLELVNENVDYHWYTVDGNWRYERIVRDRIVAGQTVNIEAGAPAIFGQVLSWGTYRLTVTDAATGASTSIRFWSGWGASSTGDRPDRLAVEAEQNDYAAGSTAKVRITPNTDGKALVVVAGDRIFSSEVIDVPADGATVDIPVRAEWGAGAYVLVTHYRPLDSALSKAPVRAIGLTWIGVDNRPRTMDVTIESPDVIAPRQSVTVPLTVANAQGEAYVTLAAVDEGVLQLTDFKSPNAAGFYFGRRRLGLDMRDDYGRLIETDLVQLGELRSGGDSMGGRGLSVVPQRIVALYSGIVALDSDGKASVTFDVPDFNGELRLMAVAWSASGVGQGSKPMTVRDDVVAEVILPRFLAPGDTASVGLNLHNVAGPAGDYTVTVRASGTVAAQGGEVRLSQNLGVNQRELLPVTLTAAGAGIGTINLTLEGPGGMKIDRAWPIEVRPAQLTQSVDEVATLAPGASYTLPATILSQFVPGSTSLSLNVSSVQGYDNVAGMMKWLDRYPYGCLEQTTSGAMPLLVFNDVAGAAGLRVDNTMHDRVQGAIDRILDMQQWSGGFGMWSFLGDEADPFIGAFAVDFLMRARAEGSYVVPQDGIDRALKWLRGVAASEGRPDIARAYAYYLLARSGQVIPGDLRYFADTSGASIGNPLGDGMLGAALLAIGDRSRANIAFGRARDNALSAQPLTYISTGYGSMLRDVSGLTAVAAEVNDNSLVLQLLNRTREFNLSLNWTTTQEKAWMLLAQRQLLAQAQPVSLSITGTTAETGGNAVTILPADAEVLSGVTVTNTGAATLYRTVSVSGAPAAPLPPMASGLSVNKMVLSLDGTPLNLATMRQNDRAIVVVSGQLSNNLYREMAVLDLLPAGWEIEGAVRRNEDGSSVYPFLPTLASTSSVVARDDRFVATFTVGSSWRSTDPSVNQVRPVFTVAYVVRAITPGTFTLPAAQVEDMYAPQIIGRTALSSVSITAAD